MPLQATSGAASYDAFGGGVPVVPNYIEEVFSTYLYTGNGSTQTITNNIDLSGQGGLVWIKSRTAYNHNLFDTTRGVNNRLFSNTTAAQTTTANSLTAFNTNGFSLGGIGGINDSSDSLVSWTFREQPKFFDVVTWTGNDVDGRVIPHNLGSTPGCILVKMTSSLSDWEVWHTALPTSHGKLNTTAAFTTSGAQYYFGNGTTAVSPTSTGFTVSASSINAGSFQYVAYLFAHDAGGFGLTGTDNVISCGSFTADGSGNFTVNLGYEPQWLMFKRTNSTSDWVIVDNMRGWTAGGDEQRLYANTSGVEAATANYESLTATGFASLGSSYVAGAEFIYIAIRRGPMKVPTVGTSVFGMSARSGTGANATVTGGQTDDAVLVKNRGSAVASLFSSRLTGTGYLVTSATDAEVAAGTTILQANPWDVMDGVKVGTTSTITNASANTYINYLFKRAPSVFDVVCYTGTGSATTFTHNLAAVPELMIVKRRSASGEGWRVWQTSIAATNADYVTELNGTDGVLSSPATFNSTSPTSTVFTVGTNPSSNSSGVTYVAYLFATCAGVSKVGSYTGTGTTLQIDCGFTAGSRFVLIKKTSDTGGWYVWDSARGIVAGNDPYLLLNSTAAEVTGTDYVDTYNAGFEISSTAPAAINENGGSFIFLAIA